LRIDSIGFYKDVAPTALEANGTRHDERNLWRLAGRRPALFFR
jgi:hypothetical protein